MNQQQKTGLFHAYHNAGISHPCDRASFKFLGVRYITDNAEQPLPVLYGDWSGGTNPEYSCESYTNWEDCTLLLTPLDRISEEHAIEVAKYVSDNIPNGRYRVSERNEHGVVIILNDVMHIRIYWNGSIIVKDCTDILYFPILNIKGVIDHLRQWNYNIGYLNYSPSQLVEMGVVKYEI